MIWGVNKIVGHRYQRVWRYYLWLVIGIRLLIPLDFSVKEAPVSLETETIYRIVNREEGISINDGNEKAAALNSGSLPSQISQERVNMQKTDLWEILFYVWFFGFGLVSVYILSGYLMQKIRIRSVYCSMPEVGVRRLWSRMKEEAGIRGNIPVCRCEVIYAPMVTGLLNKRMLLPEKDFEEKELVYIFSHEIQHLRHHDIWIKMMYLALCAVYWFQPAVWLMKREMAKDLEALCDRRAVRGFPTSERYLYTQTMIRCMTRGRDMYVPVSSGFGGDVKTMKERIMMIMKGNKLKEGFGIFSVILLLATSGMFLISCGDKEETGSDLAKADVQSVTDDTRDSKGTEIFDIDTTDSGTEAEVMKQDDETATGEPDASEEDRESKTENEKNDNTVDNMGNDGENGDEVTSDGNPGNASETAEQTSGSGTSDAQKENNLGKQDVSSDTAVEEVEIGHMDKYYCTIMLPEGWKENAIFKYDSEADVVSVVYNGIPLAGYEYAEYTFFYIIGFESDQEGKVREWYDNFTVLWSDGSYSYAFGQPLDTALGCYSTEDIEKIRALASQISGEYVKEHFVMKGKMDSI